MKQNDWLAFNLNIKDTNIDISNLRAYNITPENTGLRDKDYYKNIPQVIDAFSDESGVFNEDAFDSFYNSAKKSYNTFVSDDYITNLIEAFPSSQNDIFSLGKPIRDNRAYITNMRDPQRHAMGIGNIFERGEASFSEREVAQGNKVVDENGKELDWTPEDKGGLIKALFRPNLALGIYKDNVYDSAGNLIHQKGERIYNELGDPVYQLVGKDEEIYNRDVLRYGDTLTREGSFANKYIDIFDRDGIDNSPIKTLLWATAKIAPYLTPLGYAFGAIEAAVALGQTVPVLIKMLNGMITNDPDNDTWRRANAVENFMSRFSHTQSDYGQRHRWGLEGVAQMVVDSAGQLYSQRLIPKIPQYLAKLSGKTLSPAALRRAQALSLAYMATTSAKETYGDYIKAGLDQRMAGIGSLATMLSYYAFMSNDYFKDMIFRDPAMETPQVKFLLGKIVKAETGILAARQASNEGIKIATEEATKSITKEAGKKWYNTVFTTVSEKMKQVIPALKTISSAESPYLVTSRMLNEGVEEVMEEGVSDFFKGLTLGLDYLGVDVKQDSVEKLNFGFSPEDFLERYTTAFIGGAIGGAVFEGLTQWDNKVLHRNITQVSDLEDVDEQLSWYVRNGYEDVLLKLVDRWEQKGKTGTKDLSWDYKVVDGKIVYNQGTDENNQAKTIANILRQQIKLKKAELEALDINMDDNAILLKAMSKIKEEAKEAGYEDVKKYQIDKLRDARIDFIKQTGVDRFILTHVADIQKDLANKQRAIDAKKDEARSVPDDKKDLVDDNTPEIKRLQKQYDKRKQQLDDIMQGKAASSYLELGLFLANDRLTKIYLSELTEEQRAYAEKSVQNYTRIRYNENYNELDKGSKEVMDAEYAAWMDNTLSKKERVANALAIHKHLALLIDPVVRKQVADYYGYKTEDDRMPLIVGNLQNLQQKQLEFLQKKQVDLMSEESPDQEAIAKLNEQIRIQEEAMAQYTDPRSVLDTRLASDSENSFLSRYVKLFDNPKNFQEILDATVEYYKQLNEGKIVSEFSDDILKTTLEGLHKLIAPLVAINFETFKQSGYSLVNDFIDDNFTNLVNSLIMKPELQNTFHDITDQEGNVTSKSEAQILGELLNEFAYNQKSGDGTGKFEYNGKKQHLLHHIEQAQDPENGILSKVGTLEFDDYGEEFIKSDFNKYISDYDTKSQSEFSRIDPNQQKEIFGLINAVVNAFDSGIDDIVAAYNNLEAKLNEAITNHTLTATDAKTLINQLFGTDFVDKLLQIKELRANMIHTPILDWINALSLEVRGVQSSLWKILQDEIKGLESKTKLEQYVIDNPFSINELEFLEAALVACKAIVLGMQKDGLNAQLNKLRTEEKREELFTFDNDELTKVYLNDIEVLNQRVTYLLDLHNKNFTGTVRQKKQAFIKNAPKFIQTLVEKTSTSMNEDDPQVFIADKLKDLGFNAKATWIKIGGDKIDLNNVTAENFVEFWKVYRAFQNALYDTVKNWTSSGNRFKDIADLLVSGFTDLWKFRTSELTHLDSSVIENFEMLMWVASTIAVDPRELHGLVKTVKSTSGVSPFFDQLLGIQTGYATLEASDFFNYIVDAIYEKQNNLLDSLNIDAQSKAYLKNKSIIHNAVFFDGASGTGKSQVQLRYIRELRKLKHPEIAAIAVSEYDERTKALQDILGISENDALTKGALMKALLGRDVTSDDYENLLVDGKPVHYKVLKQSVREELRKKTDLWKSILKDRKGLDIYIDESGFLSEGDFQFFEDTLGSANIHFVYAGDEMQNGCVVETKNGNTNSGIFDIMGIKTPRLNLSMRAGNLGMIRNLQHCELILKQFLEIYKDKPWIEASELPKERMKKYGAVPEYKFRYFEDENGLFGIGFTDDAVKALEKLDRISTKDDNSPKVVVITDNLDKWAGKRSKNVDVLDVHSVQGGQYDYALIDVANPGDGESFEYFRNVYTMISRARKGVYVSGELGKAFPKTSSADMDSTAAIDVNPTANNAESDAAMDDYSVFFDSLFEDDVWDSKKPTTPVKTPGAPIPAPNPTGSPTPTGNLPTVKGVPSRPGVPDFNLDDFLKSIEEFGLDSPYLQEWYSGTKRSDYENYQKYMFQIRTQGNSGSLIETKQFIDWLYNPSSSANSVLFEGPRTLTKLLQALTPAQKETYKGLVQDVSMDLLMLSEEELTKKYIDSNEDVLEQWAGTNGLFNGYVDEIAKFFKTIPEAKSEQSLELYAVRDGETSYLYHIGEGYAIPVAIINNFALEGGVKINTSVFTPMILVSTNGNQFKPLKDVVGHYAHYAKDSYIVIADPDKIATAVNSGLVEFISEGRGKPMAIITVNKTYDSDIAQILSRTPDDQNPNLVHRIDTTGISKGTKRLSGVSNWVTLKQWIDLTSIVKKMKDGENVTSEERSKLDNYISDKARKEIDLVSGTSDPYKLFSALGKVQLLTSSSRKLLCTALIRYFDSIKGDKSKLTEYQQFINNLLKWNSVKYPSNDGEYIRQKGFEFVINGSGSREIYHILQSEDGNYNIASQGIQDGVEKEVILGQLTAAEWFNINNVDPINASKNLLSLIKLVKANKTFIPGQFNTVYLDEKSELYKYFVSDVKEVPQLEDTIIENLLRNGEITIGVTTRSETTVIDNETKIVNQEIRYYSPYDTDLLDLLDGINVTENGDLDKFLKADTKFKYNFLVSTPITSDFNPDWAVGKESDILQSDLGAVLPPLLTISVAGSSNGKFRDLGTLNHKVEVSNPKEAHITVELNEDGSVKSWIFDKPLIVSAEDLKKYTGAIITGTKATILKATPKSITLKVGSTEELIDRGIEVNPELFRDVPKTEGKIGDKEILNNGVQRIVRNTDGEYVIRERAATYDFKIVQETPNIVRVWCGDRKGILEFKKMNSDTLFERHKHFADGIYLGTTGDGITRSLWYLNKDVLTQFGNENTKESHTIRLTTDGKVLDQTTGVELELETSLINQLTQYIKPIKPQKRSDIKEASEKLRRGTTIAPFEGRTKKQADSWARENAILLGGIYEYNEKEHEFFQVADPKSMILMKFARWTKDIGLDPQSVINQNPNIQIFGSTSADSNVVSIELDGTTYKFNFMVTQKGEIELKQIIDDIPIENASIIDFDTLIKSLPTNLLQFLTDENTKYIKLLLRSELGESVNTNTPDFNKWIKNTTNEIDEIIELLETEITRQQQQNACIVIR